MSELAFNVNGERFEVPDEAEFWRVRRFKPSGRGTPEVVFDADGLPLLIAIDTDIHEFRQLVDGYPARYRLDAIDADQKACQGATAAYVQLAHQGESPSSGETEGAAEPSRNDDLIRDLVRVNAELVKNITDKFAIVMESAATLLRAADGAGLPARQPLALSQSDKADHEDEGEEDEQRNASGFDLGAFLGQMMPMFQMVMAQRNQGDAVPSQTRNATLEIEEDDDCEDEVDGDDNEVEAETPASHPGSQAQGPEAIAHFAAVQSKLTPEEAQLARAVASELPPEEINGWIAQLSRLAVDDAVELIRETIRKTTVASKAGGTS